ncbi:HAD family phosphatase [Candidatus Dojkabacteria bacterium]|uniref:HAD family phosphatase n=1 Tax=Candidatus Dojkabacteria bacterium TaxID=2099670 RepID=A0A955RKA6_9BACT|nr:HAD family phosphatase [Candidatus Dojkabacteria bacterium]
MNEEKSIKLLFLDVDGTLTTKWEIQVSKSVLFAISKLSETVMVSLSTGRISQEVKELINLAGLEQSYHVIGSGAEVYGPSMKLLRKKVLSYDDVTKVIDLAEDIPDGYGICHDGTWLDSPDAISKGMEFITLSLHANSKEQKDKILNHIQVLDREYHITVGSHIWNPEGFMILITQKGASKGDAIKYVQSELGISQEETAGIGDMPNDAPMFSQCGLKIAMGNAHPDLRQLLMWLYLVLKKMV